MKNLKDRYNDIANKYIVAFKQKHNLEFYGWINDEVRIADFGCTYFIELDDIRFDIDNNCPPQLILNWLDDALEYFHEHMEVPVNFENYSKEQRFILD